MNYSFGLRGHDIADNFEEMCQKARENGISKLQFAMAKTMNNIDFDKLGYDERLACEVNEKLKEYGLDVAVLGCYINPVDENRTSLEAQLRRFDSFIDYAAAFNAGGVGTETGSVRDLAYTHSDENYRNFLKNIELLVRKAEDKNVMIYIEPVCIFTIYSVERAAQMLSDIDSKNLGIILDIANIINAENAGRQDYIIQSAFDSLGEKIRAVHLKDFKFSGKDKQFALAGEGELNIGLLFDGINQMQKKPDIILDETPLEFYGKSCDKLREILGR